MKSIVKFYLHKWRVCSGECDDRPDYKYPVETVTLSYSHLLFNKNRRMKKAIWNYINNLKSYPYAIVASWNKDYNGWKIADAAVIDPCMFKHESNKEIKDTIK